MRDSRSRAIRRMAFASMGLIVLSLAAPVPALAAPSPSPGPSASSSPGSDGSDASKPQAIDFAVVVDESGSISPPALADEKDAASLLTQSELSPESRAMVIGFGSSNQAGQTPVDEVCSLVALDTAGRQRLSSCVNGLRSRTPADGDDTDIPAAIQQAVSRLTAIPGPAHPRVIFVLTDGKLDVHNSPQYGQPADRNTNAADLLRTSVLPAAVQGGVQIWPLGFGDQIDSSELNEIAAGGFQSRCADLPSARPQATTVANSGDVTVALQRAFAAARCARFQSGTQGVPPTDLYVDIPPIATDGSITVTKRDPRVKVTYFDPSGDQVPTTGTFDGSVFDVSGQDGPVEALRIINPLPGRWRINLATPAGSSGQVASTSALWQGVLHSSITLNPPQPTPGERAVVEVRLQTRRGLVISNPADLAEVRVSVRLSSSGLTPLDVPLADDGRAPDARSGDGVFTGYLTMPAAAHGAVSIVGNAVAEGITGDQRPIEAILLDTPSPVIATPTIAATSVYPGGSATGGVVVQNNDDKTHTLALTLADLDPKSQIQVTPTSFDVPAGARHTVSFTLAFGTGSPLGMSPGRLIVTDRTAGGRQLGSTFIQVLVMEQPSWPRRHWLLLTAAGALLAGAAAALVVHRRAVRSRRDPHKLTVHLHHQGREVATWPVSHPQPNGFGFSVTGEGSRSTVRAAVSGARYVLFRSGAAARVRTPSGADIELQLANPIGIGPDLELSVTDTRRGGSRPPRQSPRQRPTNRRPADTSTPITTPVSTAGCATDHPDM